MRTFHTGGVAGDDITQGLPRVEELFEARKPKGLAIVSEIAGRVHIIDTKKTRNIEVINDEKGESKTYPIPYGSSIKVTEGEEIEAGDELTEGSVNPHDILKIKGVQAVQKYLLQEVQKVYDQVLILMITLYSPQMLKGKIDDYDRYVPEVYDMSIKEKNKLAKEH